MAAPIVIQYAGVAYLQVEALNKSKKDLLKEILSSQDHEALPEHVRVLANCTTASQQDPVAIQLTPQPLTPTPNVQPSLLHPPSTLANPITTPDQMPVRQPRGRSPKPKELANPNTTKWMTGYSPDPLPEEEVGANKSRAAEPKQPTSTSSTPPGADPLPVVNSSLVHLPVSIAYEDICKIRILLPENFGTAPFMTLIDGRLRFRFVRNLGAHLWITTQDRRAYSLFRNRLLEDIYLNPQWWIQLDINLGSNFQDPDNWKNVGYNPWQLRNPLSVFPAAVTARMERYSTYHASISRTSPGCDQAPFRHPLPPPVTEAAVQTDVTIPIDGFSTDPLPEKDLPRCHQIIHPEVPIPYWAIALQIVHFTNLGSVRINEIAPQSAIATKSK